MCKMFSDKFLCQINHSSGTQFIRLTFYFCTVAALIFMPLRYYEFIMYLLSTTFEDETRKFWAAPVIITNMSLRFVNATVALYFWWRAAYRDPKFPLNFLLHCQFPFELFLVVFEIGISIIFPATTDNLQLTFRLILKMTSLMLKIVVCAIVYNYYKIVCSPVLAKLKFHCRNELRESEPIENDKVVETINDVVVREDEFQSRLLDPLGLFIDTSSGKGEGEFGCVFGGRWKGTEVAVKVNKTGKAHCELGMLIQEIKIRIAGGYHENIVNFLGATAHKNFREFKDPLCMIMELCEHGSLENFLVENRSTFVQLEMDETNDSEIKFLVASKMSYVNLDMHGTHSTIDLLRISREIASGMEHLAARRIIHGDLAARNVLLTSNLRAKLTDFGMSRKLYNYQMYFQAEEAKSLPWRWMAIESIMDFKFSLKSDIYSYGVLLWEIFTLGEFPFKEISWNMNIVTDLRNGLQLEKPIYASNSMYELMQQCWSIEPKLRPSFLEIFQYFQKYDFVPMNLLQQKLRSSALIYFI